MLQDTLQLLHEERGLHTIKQDTATLRGFVEVLSPGNDFIFLMAGTLNVYHCPVRPIKVKRYNYSIDTKNIQNTYESPNDK